LKRKSWICICTLLLLLAAFPVTAQADMGPKPSVTVSFIGLENEAYYVTLLSERDSTGPWSKGNMLDTTDDRIWQIFNSYTDQDGFYFIGYFSDCSTDDIFRWTYYPPETFKILIYFPEQDQFAVSTDIYTRYAFHSDYTVNCADWTMPSDTISPGSIHTGQVYRSYDYSWEILSLLCRIVLTIAVELAVALPFGFRSRKQLLLIGIVNVITQVLLNLSVNFVHYLYGAWAFILAYVLLELLVFAIEGIVYCLRLRRFDAIPERKMYPWAYAFSANAASAVMGFLIARWLPGIF
jgi:hypothetical protein